MKKSFILYLGIIFTIIISICIACSNSNKTTITSNTGINYKVIVIDSCEYLVRKEGYKGFMAHKGNCKFCKERNKQYGSN
jgi:hypothetical protein